MSQQRPQLNPLSSQASSAAAAAAAVATTTAATSLSSVASSSVPAAISSSSSSALVSNPVNSEVVIVPASILNKLSACKSVSEIVTQLRDTTDLKEREAYQSFLLKILEKARQTIVLREEETLKSIFPLIELYPDKILNILIDELKRSALRTNPYLYIGLSSVLQMALADESIRNKIGQASFLSLLNYVVGLFNTKVMITPGDQTIPYLALDVLNLCIMNMKVLRINPLPATVKEGIESVLKVLEPHNKGISDVIKMQRLYAENMMQSINADISTWDKILPFLGPLAKLGLGIGLIGAGTGIIAGTEGAAASQGAKLIWSGLQSSAVGTWELYKAIQAAYPNLLNWYAKTLAIYIKCSAMEALKDNKEVEKDFITFLQYLRQEDNLGKCNIGLLGIIYRLTQLYPSVNPEVRKEIILTLSAIGYKPEKNLVATVSSSLTKSYPNASLRKNAMVALKYLAETHDSGSASKEYKKCHKRVGHKDNLEKAIKVQEPFFKRLNDFVQETSAELERIQPTLLKEVLEEEKIRANQLKQLEKGNSADTRLVQTINVNKETKKIDAPMFEAENVPASELPLVLEHHRNLAKQGATNEVNINAKTDEVITGMFNVRYSNPPVQSKDKKSKHKKESKKEKKSNLAGFFRSENSSTSSSSTAAAATTPTTATSATTSTTAVNSGEALNRRPM